MVALNSQALEALGPQTMAKRVDMAKFPQQLSPQEKALVIEVALSYGLDPLMGELTVFQGKPFVTIDGRYRKAHETGELAGVASRPATKQERDDWQILEGDYFFRAEVYRKDSTMPFVGWGRVRKEETAPPKSGAGGFRPLEVNPQRMAEKRAEAQALRKAFYLPLPSAEGPGDENDTPAPPVGNAVDTKTKPPVPAPTPAPPTDDIPAGDWLGNGEPSTPPAASPPDKAEASRQAMLRTSIHAALVQRYPIVATQGLWLATFGARTVDEIPVDHLEEALRRITGQQRPSEKASV